MSVGLATPTNATSPAPRARVPLGQLVVDHHTRDSALDAIERLVRAGRGGRVFTPNLDHILLVERRDDVRAAYARAALCLADGMPLVWASRRHGQPLPERICGADLIEPLAERAARAGWSLFLLGGAPGAADDAAYRLAAAHGVRIAGCVAPRIAADGTTADAAAEAELAAQIRASGAQLVFVALGSPKQELFIDRIADAVAPAVLLGVGAGVDFLAGRVRRAPAWIGRLGFEWLFRLVVEPRRLWRRYLVGGPPALRALWRAPAAR
ncbi:MAG TPA: WecB/TagA/CpsF family glycosyltransferase [Gemmatimonadaceae bacterium]|nr:WecB/TagA/CpsF family glycosyltransferase [Gemmatimonadaceae bacterium]